MSRIAVLHDFPRQSVALRAILNALYSVGHSLVLPETVQIGRTVAQTILDQIERSDVVVIIISRGSPNIYYELGIVTALRKPRLLLVRDRLKVPTDVSNNLYLSFNDRSLRESSFHFKLIKQIELVSDRDQSKRQLPAENSAALQLRYERSFENYQNDRDFSNEHNLENWIASLVSSISQRDVTKSEAVFDRGYDFAIWNNINDTLLATLGNPIVFQIKAQESLPKTSCCEK